MLGALGSGRDHRARLKEVNEIGKADRTRKTGRAATKPPTPREPHEGPLKSTEHPADPQRPGTHLGALVPTATIASDQLVLDAKTGACCRVGL